MSDQRGSASHETDRHTDDQPPREDLIPVDEFAEMSPEEADPARSEDDAVLPRPDPEDLPESQGYDASLGDKISEDPVERPRLSDEEL
jgi:hypothetical protein